MNGNSLHGAILSSALAHRDKTAFNYFTDGWESITYGEFAAMARSAASALRGLGVGKGDRAAIIAGNGPRWCAAYLGALMAGAVAVPVDARLTPAEIRNILVDSEARAAVFDHLTREAVATAARGLETKLLDLGSVDWSKADDAVSEAAEDDMAALLYTSGTTGAPKAVVLTHGNFLSDAGGLVETGVVSSGDNVLAVLPLHHTYAFMATFVVPVLLGAAVTFPRGIKGPDITAACREKGVTVLIAVPQMLELMRNRMVEKMGSLPGPAGWAMKALLKINGMLRRRAGLNPMKAVFHPLGRQMKFLGSGGARLDPKVMLDLEAMGFTVVEGYGLTETSPVITFNPPGRRRPGSAGRPIKGVELKILAPTASGEGEVAARGPMVMRGYYRKPKETALAFSDGWFRTGDLGYIDREGYLFLTGRLKEVIVLSSGKNVYPEEVEAHYRSIPLIKEICVIEKGDTLHAVVVPDQEAARAARVGNIGEALKWEINKRSMSLPPHMKVKGFTLTAGPLPRTPLGKIRRFMVGRMAEAGAAKPVGEDDPALLADEVGRAAVAALKPLSAEGSAIRAESSLELDLGLDSLKRLEAIVSLEKALGRGLPDTLASEAQTVGELVGRIKAAPLAEPGRRGGEALDALLSGEPTEDEKRMVGLEGGAVRRATLIAGAGLVKAVLKVFWGLEVRGVENLPERPFLIAANHSSYMDGPVVLASVPRSLRASLYFQGDRKIFSGRLLAAVARLAHVIPIDPDAALGAALRVSSHVLRAGNALFIFPEGGRTFDGSVMPFKRGVGMLALRLGVPVVPAYIEGTYSIYPRHRRRPGRGRVRVTFGRPLGPSEFKASEAGQGEGVYQGFADTLRERVLALKGR